MPEERTDPLNDCPECWEHFCEHPILEEAFATVGMESDISSDEIARIYFGLYHEQGHRLKPSRQRRKKGR